MEQSISKPSPHEVSEPRQKVAEEEEEEEEEEKKEEEKEDKFDLLPLI